MELKDVINNNTVIRLAPYIGFNAAKMLAMIANSSFNLEKKSK